MIAAAPPPTPVVLIAPAYLPKRPHHLTVGEMIVRVWAARPPHPDPYRPKRPS